MSEQGILFSKMHGLGNDFVVIDAISQNLDWKKLPFQHIADRHFGIGCDQILIIQQSDSADFFCRIINADGSEAEQCGNGLRCVARYIIENGLHKDHNLTLATTAGVFPIDAHDFEHIRISLSVPELSSTSLELVLAEQYSPVNGQAVSIGNPHFIVPVDKSDDAVATQLGGLISTHNNFPQGTNVGFVETLSRQHVRLRTYERGAGLTHACGSNACAAVVAGVLGGQLDKCVDVEFRYGKLKIEWHGKGQPIFMSGPASVVFTGEYFIK